MLKKERRIELVKHPEMGSLEKEYLYTYNSDKYNTLDEAIEKKDIILKEFCNDDKVDLSRIDIDSLTEDQLDKLRVKLGITKPVITRVWEFFGFK